MSIAEPPHQFSRHPIGGGLRAFTLNLDKGLARLKPVVDKERGFEQLLVFTVELAPSEGFGVGAEIEPGCKSARLRLAFLGSSCPPHVHGLALAIERIEHVGGTATHAVVLDIPAPSAATENAVIVLELCPAAETSRSRPIVYGVRHAVVDDHPALIPGLALWRTAADNVTTVARDAQFSTANLLK